VATQERAKRTREHVLDAAADEFSVHGYAHTTMNAVADRIGMTKGALYGHFASKDELVDTIVRHGHDAWISVVAQADETCSAAPLCTVGSLTVGLARRLTEDPRARAAFRLVADQLTSGDPGPNLLKDVRIHMVGLVQQAQERDEVTPRYPATAIVELLLAMVSAVHSATWPTTGIPAIPWVESVWDMVRRSLRA
jgi:AcrR family transcriptional regulator